MTKTTSTTSNAATYVVCGIGYVEFAVEITAASEDEAVAIFERCADTLIHNSNDTYYTNLDVREIAELDAEFLAENA